MDTKREPASFHFEVKPHILIVEGRYYNDIGDRLLTGARAVLDRHEAVHEIITVPGAFEIPSAISYAVKSLDFDAVRRRFDGFIALGCIVRGETNHHEIIGHESARALQELALRYVLAIGNGILTCHTHDQAMERANPAQGDRGGAAAEACLRMIEIKQQFRLTPKRRWVAK